jgi:hypothetical protein
MENLTFSDPPRGGTPHSGGQLGPGAAPPPGPPQLPPQMFTTAAQLLDLTDSEILPPCLPTSTTTTHYLTDIILKLLCSPGSSLQE